jgi:hypothetical protein
MHSFFREGKAFYLKADFEETEEFNTLGGRDSRRMLTWPKPSMLNLFSSHALNDVEISLAIREKDSKGEVSLKRISRTELNLADVSLFMEGGSEKDILNVAFELDYQQLEAGSKRASNRQNVNYDFLGFSHAE